MKYEAPAKSPPSEILDTLDREDVTPDQRIKAVLSAIFYGGTVEFAGDVLIKEFSSADYEQKIDLQNLFGTFYHSWRTTYRIDESIGLLETYKSKNPRYAAETQEVIEELLEFKTMFERS